MRKLAADAVTNANDLLSTIQAAAFGTVSQAISGKVLIEASAGGVSTRYELPPGASGLGPQEVSALLSRMLDRYDAAVAAIGGTPTDAQILAKMLTNLTVIRSHSTDFSLPYIRP